MDAVTQTLSNNVLVVMSI